MHYQRNWQPVANLLSLLFNTFNSWVQTLPMDAPATQPIPQAPKPTQEQLQAAYDAHILEPGQGNTIPKDNILAEAVNSPTTGTPSQTTKTKNKLAGSAQ